MFDVDGNDVSHLRDQEAPTNQMPQRQLIVQALQIHPRTCLYESGLDELFPRFVVEGPIAKRIPRRLAAA